MKKGTKVRIMEYQDVWKILVWIKHFSNWHQKRIDRNFLIIEIILSEQMKVQESIIEAVKRRPELFVVTNEINPKLHRAPMKQPYHQFWRDMTEVFEAIKLPKKKGYLPKSFDMRIHVKIDDFNL